LERLRRIK
jgi:hypothetical protein